MPTEPRLIQKAYKFALDPTPTQARAFASHAGGARFAYNWGISTYAAALDARKAQTDAGQDPTVDVPNHFALCKAWTQYKDTYRLTGDPDGRPVHWVEDNFVGTYQAALRDAHGAWQKMWDSRNGQRKGRAVGRPRFKKKGRSPDSFQMHGDSLRLDSGRALRPADATARKPLNRAERAKLAPTPGMTPTERSAAQKRLRAGRKARAGHVHGPQVSQSGTIYVNLPKVGPVRVPGRVRIPQVTPSVAGWVDRNSRTARKLLRQLAKAATTGPVVCPTCAGTGTVTVTTKKGERRDTKCGKYHPTVRPEDKLPGCQGKGKVEPARIVRATISRGASGTWWCSITTEQVITVPVITTRRPAHPTRRQLADGSIGVDLGVKYLAVLSTGDTYMNSRFLDSALTDLKRMQKVLSRTAKDSHRRLKARRRVGTLHEQVALMRRDATNRVTTELARKYATISVEGWDAQRLAELGSKDLPKRLRRNRNRALADAAPGMLRWQLEYKTSWYGSTLFKGEPHWETGRICSVCGTARTKPVPLAEEQFRCPQGHVLPRRVNSARVMDRVARGLVAAPATPEPRGGDVRPATPRRGGPSPAKRVARSRKRGKTGTPDP